MGKILPLLLALMGLAAGGGAGYYLRPVPTDAPTHSSGKDVEPIATGGDIAADDEPTVEYVKLNNQFVVPIVERGSVAGLVIMSLSLEVGIGETEAVYRAEPKIRDSLLQVLFDHANVGGFNGAFTGSTSMDSLRRALLEACQKILGDSVRHVLVSDIVRQDNR